MRNVIRYVGIDFGTSTSAVCYKDYYEDGEPLDWRDAEPVTFGRFTTVPTVVLIDQANNTHFGDEAAFKAEEYPELLQSEFKMDLMKADRRQAQAAAELTQRFLEHAYGEYRLQSKAMHGRQVRQERFVISYPAKWPTTARERTKEAAKRAGFQNVSGMVEPEAAMRYFSAMRTNDYNELEKRGVIAEGRRLNVLLVDMGAGTTDLVLYTYTPGGEEHFVLNTWPPVDVARREYANFGGREIDELLFDRVVVRALPEGWLDSFGNAKRAWVAQFRQETRAWKERTVSPELGSGECIERLPHSIVRQLRRDGYEEPRIKLDRGRFEDLLGDYLSSFPRLVNGLIAEATKEGKIGGGEDIDLAVLTGGHSQWYFVEEMLAGKLSRFGNPTLPKIRDEPVRVMRGPDPQETVARGMALSWMPFRIRRVASNSAWLKMEVGETKIEPLQIQEMGGPLRADEGDHMVTEHAWRVDYRFAQFAAQMRCRCDLLVGQTLGKAETFDVHQFVVPYEGFWTKLAQWWKEDDVGILYMRVAVDQEEGYRIEGALTSMRSGRHGFFRLNHGRELTPAEKKRLEKVMETYVGDKLSAT